MIGGVEQSRLKRRAQAVVEQWCYYARSPDDTRAWWLTGRPDQMWWWILYKSSLGKQVRLHKMAGECDVAPATSVSHALLTTAIVVPILLILLHLLLLLLSLPQLLLPPPPTSSYTASTDYHYY